MPGNRTFFFRDIILESSAAKYLARIAWGVPIVLLLLTIQQAKVTVDLGATMREGVPAVAEITRYDRTDRKDVTHAELDLRVKLPDGTLIEKEHLALPYTIAHRVEDTDSVDVLVFAGSSQEVVIASIVGTQQRIALYNIGMGFIAFVLAAVGVYYWNRMVDNDDDM
jgi:hypothetical protein